MKKLAQLWIAVGLSLGLVLLLGSVVCADGPPIANGGFEEGFDGQGVATGWKSFHNDGAAFFGWYDDSWDPVVPEGDHAQLIEISVNSDEQAQVQGDRYAGIYQTVVVSAGTPYTLSLSGLMRASTFDNPDHPPYDYGLQIGFDYAGGEDWQAVSDWIEIPWDLKPRVADTFVFDHFATSVTPTGDTLTIFIRAQKKWPVFGEGDFDVDDVRLTGPALASAPTPTPTSAPAEEQPTTPGMPVTGAGQRPQPAVPNAHLLGGLALLGFSVAVTLSGRIRDR